MAKLLRGWINRFDRDQLMANEDFGRLTAQVDMLENRLLQLEREGKARSVARQFIRRCELLQRIPSLVISVTSHKARIHTLSGMLMSLAYMEDLPEYIEVNLAVGDFPRRELDLPSDLLDICTALQADICWTEDDLGPHNKYVWSIRRHPECSVITIDDDIYYHPLLVSWLWKAHQRHPGCIVSARTHAISFGDDGLPNPYVTWRYEQRDIVDTPSRILLPTGVGGVLYPPHCLPEVALDPASIKEACPRADDLWLKFMSAASEVYVVATTEFSPLDQVAGSQVVSLCGATVEETGAKNDAAIKKLLDWMGDRPELISALSWIRGD